jgi:hypothetical protein
MTGHVHRDRDHDGQGAGRKALTFLTSRQVTIIDELLASVSPYGEVRLTVEKGILRFFSSTRSYDAYKYRLREDGTPAETVEGE